GAGRRIPTPAADPSRSRAAIPARRPDAMKPPDARRRPQAFRLDETRLVAGEAEAQTRRPGERDFRLESQPDPYASATDPAESPEEALIEGAQRRGMLRRRLLGWAGLFWSALSGL